MDTFLGRRPRAVIDTLRSLADDIERIVEGDPHLADQIETAPLLEAWEMRPRFVPAIEALHPQGQERVVTSELLVLDIVGGWCRTRNRFYRLGDHVR